MIPDRVRDKPYPAKWWPLGRIMFYSGTEPRDPRSLRQEGPPMIRFLLLIAVIAIGADAILNNGAYTQAAWRELSAHAVKIQGSGTDATVSLDKRQ
jgi:hypothetical protein